MEALSWCMAVFQTLVLGILSNSLPKRNVDPACNQKSIWMAVTSFISMKTIPNTMLMQCYYSINTYKDRVQIILTESTEAANIQGIASVSFKRFDEVFLKTT